MPFSLQPRGYKVAKNAESIFENGKQERSARGPGFSALCSVVEAGRRPPPPVKSAPRGWNYFQPRRSPVCSNAPNSLESGVASRILSAHCVTVDTETERLFWHCIGRAASSGRRIRRGQVPLLEGRQVLCDRMDFWRIGAVFAAERWSL